MVPMYDMSLCHVLLSSDCYSKLIPLGLQASSLLHSLFPFTKVQALISKVTREMACLLTLKTGTGLEMDEGFSFGVTGIPIGIIVCLSIPWPFTV